MSENRYKSLDEFWPYYVQEHSQSTTRWWHFVGSTNLFFWLTVALFRKSFRTFIFAVITSYWFAWIGHFFFEQNIPATFRYPFLAGLGDMRMYFLMWQGKMDAEVKRYTGDN